MSKFALQDLKLPGASTRFYALVKDGVSQYDLFEQECIKNSNDGYLGSVWSYMVSLSTNKSLPPKVIKPINGIGKNCYRIRKDPLRVYYIKNDLGYIFILGGVKPNQTSDINKFKNLKDNIKSDIEILKDLKKV